MTPVNISLSVSKTDGKVKSFIQKWRGQPQCPSETGPITAVHSLGYKQEETRLVLELRESTDQSVRNANAKVFTGRKWKAQAEVDRAVGRLQRQEVVGRVQAGRGRTRVGRSATFQANRKETKEMVVSEATTMEDERYKVKAVSQGRQGSWTTWGGGCRPENQLVRLVEDPTGKDLIRSTYATLPCPRNPHEWFGNEEFCSLCNTPNASLQHILSGVHRGATDGAMTRSLERAG